MNNQFLIVLQAKLDEAKSIDNLNGQDGDIAKLQEKLEKLKLQVTLDQNAAQNLAVDIGKLINQKIIISDIAINQSNLSKTGQQIERVISDNTEKAIGNVTSKNIGKYFRVSQSDSRQFQLEMEKLVSGWTNGKGKVTDISIQTRTSYDKDAGENIERLHQATVAYKNELNEVIKKTIAWRQIGTTTNAKGEEEVLRGFVEVAGQYSKAIDTVNTKTDNFVEKQKNAVASAQNTLATIESKLHDKGANRTLANTDFNANGLNNQINAVKNAIDLLDNASMDTFAQAQRDIDKEINTLNNLISTLKNTEYAATSLRSKDVATIKIDEGNKLDSFVQKMEQSGHYTDELKQSVSNLRNQLDGIFNKNDIDKLTSYLNGFSNLQTRFKAVDETAKTVEKSTKLKTNIDSEKRILQIYTTELKEAGVLTGDVKSKIQDMFRSLSKIDSQNALTTWRAELKGVKAETDIVLKSVQTSSTKERDVYEAALKELKKLYDLKIEYAKLGSNKNTDFYYGTAIENQENVWQKARSKTSEPENWNMQKRLELEREELAMQEKLDQAYNKVANAKQQADQVHEIQLLSNGGIKNDYSTQIAKLEGNFRSLGFTQDEVSKKMGNIASIFDTLKEKVNQPFAEGNYQEIISLNKSLQGALAESGSEYEKLRAAAKGYVSEQQRLSKANVIEAWNIKNKNATQEVLEKNQQYINSLRDLDKQMTQTDFNAITDGFNRTKNSMTAFGKTASYLKTQISQAAASIVSFVSLSRVAYSAINALRKMPSTVTDLDTALVDLKKTAKMSAEELEDFYYSANDTAKQMGVTTEEIIKQAAAWSRLGFSTAEAATKMAKLSSQFALISPGLSVDDATSGLVSVMKAYDISVSDVLDGIESKINIIGNNLALSNANIVKMLQDSVSAMAESRNTLEETIALESAAYEIVQNESVGNGFKTVALRLRGMNEETEELDDSLKSIKGDLYELTGVSIMEDENTYKSTYQILKEISGVWNSLTDKTRSEALELMFGKLRSNIGAAVLKNFTAAEKAMDLMVNSAGNADAELSVAMDSIEYKMNRLSETGTSIAQNLFKREDMKSAIDALNSLLSIVDKSTDKIGLFGTIGLGAGLFAGIKNVGMAKLN